MTATDVMTTREQANAEAVRRMTGAEPVLVDVRRAGEVVPGMTPSTILTSGPPMPWPDYYGGQRNAVIYGALYEGLATDPADADAKLSDGRITLAATHDHGCVGSVAGIYTASMPVFVVENTDRGNRAFCNFYEGESRRRLNYGSYDDEVRVGLDFLRDELAPVLRDVVRATGGVPLKPLIGRALRMGDELHSRNTAATTLFTRELTPQLIDFAVAGHRDAAQTALRFFAESDYSFLRLSMAAAKAMADAARDVPAASVVTAMTISCRNFAIRVSGLGDEWFLGPLPEVACKLFDGFTEADIQWIGGESHITETVGLGGFAQAAAFGLQAYQGGSAAEMARLNSLMYEITVAEHPDFLIPYFGFRGTPVGIDVFKVTQTGTTPVIDGGLAGKDGGQIGAGILRAPLDCFTAASLASGLPPFRRPNENDTDIEGFVKVPNGPIESVNFYQIVTPQYFETIGARLMEGRWFDQHDGPARSVIVNQTMANTFWPHQSAIGRRVRPGTKEWYTVVGVVADIKNAGADRPTGTELFVPYNNADGGDTDSPYILVRTRGNPAQLANAVREAVRSLDPGLPVAKVRIMEDVVAAASSRPRFLTLILGLFSVLACCWRRSESTV